MSVVRNCLWCEKEFQPSKDQVQRGIGKFCSSKCVHQYRFRDYVVPIRTCLNCDKTFKTFQAEIKKGGGKFCSKACWYEFKRKNSQTKSIYKYRRMPQHPMATEDGKIRLSRAVLFDKIGLDEITCFWCDTSLKWYTEWKHPVPADYLTADHVDFDTHNDTPENLVPACMNCNMTRHRRVGDGELFVIQKQYIRRRAREVQCSFCGKTLLRTLTSLRQFPNPCCDRSCVSKFAHQKAGHKITPGLVST